MKGIKTSAGHPLPLGPSLLNDGIQFSVFSRHARSVSLLLFHKDSPDSSFDEIVLDPLFNKTGDIWHIKIHDKRQGQIYAYRMDGPYLPFEGHRYNRNRILVDPYAEAVTGNFIYDMEKLKGYDTLSAEEDLSFSNEEFISQSPKSIMTAAAASEYDRPLNIPEEKLIIYELHLKGYTCDTSSGVSRRGTYAGLTEKIPYLKDLGINAVELLPVQEFDEYENTLTNPLTGDKLKNFWGYSPLSFFAVKASYSSSGTLGQQVDEFREMVAAFHKAGIEVILDVVYNHTSEGDENGPTVSFRGIDNSIYYILEENKRFYKNYSGCGNTFNCNHPLARNLILDSLRYWAVEMKIDGFRFDLASILGRDVDGRIMGNASLLEIIEEDPILRNRKIIAEAWDAAGAYQLGHFPGRWAEWNGKYRDDVRKFWRGDKNTVGSFATRISGSSDLYHGKEMYPLSSVNFVTCHDGFTLNDLVSYLEKNNYANGENNLDGEDHNHSDNFGFEGVCGSLYVNAMRLRQMRNFILTLMVSQGIPMILGGDEFRRTQKGNNNAYCQDNEISWVNWNMAELEAGLSAFTKRAIQFRKETPLLARKTFFTGASGISGPDISWHGFRINEPDWSRESRSIAVLLNGKHSVPETEDIYIIFNASMINRYYDLPGEGRRWKLLFDTSCENNEPGDRIHEGEYPVKKLSMAVLKSAD